MQIVQWLIPASNKKTRPGIKRTPMSITIHETGNPNKGANAKSHARLQELGNSRQASWHYQVDDGGIIYQSVPDNEVAWAGGDGNGAGNMYSIHIEICVNSDGNYKKAVENAAWLVRFLLKKYPHISIRDVVQHHRWSGKNCPQLMRSGTKGATWNGFLSLIDSKEDEKKLEELKKLQIKVDTLQTTVNSLANRITNLNKFLDFNGPLSGWAKKDWEEATKNKYVDGTDPRRFARREEVAKIVNAVVRDLKK